MAFLQSLRGKFATILLIGYVLVLATTSVSIYSMNENTTNLEQLIQERVEDPEVLSAVTASHDTLERIMSVFVLITIVTLIVALSVTVFLVDRFIIQRARRIVDHLSRMADFDLSKELESRGNDELSQITREAAMLQNQFSKTLADFTRVSNMISSASENLREASSSSFKGVDKQRRNHERLATSFTELAASATEVAANASQAAESAQEADKESGVGRNVVNANNDSINVLVNKVQDAADLINRLEEHSNNIGTILGVIRGIAEQTNLLALNAAIEAARAGEQGRGFAVVADEVRTLAQRTQQSTEEIQEMIEKLQTGSKSAVSEMEASRVEAEQCKTQAQEAGEALQRITVAVSQINEMNTQIAQAASEQNRTVEDVNETVHEVQNTTEENLKLSDTTSSTCQNLSSLASELLDLTAKFKLQSLAE